VRLGVLDVGSNTVHLLVVDAHHGAHPTPQSSQKSVLRLAEQMDARGKITREGANRLISTIREAVGSADELGCEDLIAFATSALRDASNANTVLERVYAETGVELAVLTGEQEAILTFLAARRWFGWSAGRLLVVDVGGGSLEIAVGMDEEPDVAVSLPLGAGRLTRAWLSSDPPRRRELDQLREHITSSWQSQPGSCGRPAFPTGWWEHRRPSGRWPGSAVPPPTQRGHGCDVPSPMLACAR
jgi:exopolyphosphatase/guanosine-5'-triphosphate,3'-diphosphate pyrophosphatase